MSDYIPKVCKIEDCSNIGGYDKSKGKHYLSLGYCEKHYRRYKRHGVADMATRSDDRPAIVEGDIVKIPLGVEAKYGYAIVDARDAHIGDTKWVLSNNGYVYNGKTLLHHAVVGHPPLGKDTDHINRNKLDNRRSNLRFISRKNNTFNRGLRSNNTTGYVGVSILKNAIKKRYTACYSRSINGRNKTIYIGSFETAKEAAIARDKIVAKIHGEYAYLNFPD